MSCGGQTALAVSIDETRGNFAVDGLVQTGIEIIYNGCNGIRRREFDLYGVFFIYHLMHITFLNIDEDKYTCKEVLCHHHRLL